MHYFHRGLYEKYGISTELRKNGCGLERWGKNDRQYEFDIEKVRKIKGNIKKEKTKTSWMKSVRKFLFYAYKTVYI